MTKITIEDFVKKYSSKTGVMTYGALCFYGHWFGKPGDNYHELESVDFDDINSELTLRFDHQETLLITNPQGIQEVLLEEGRKKLIIESADKIRWEWFSYGDPKTPENSYFIQILREGSLLFGESNVDWYKIDFSDLDITASAVLWALF